MDTPVFKPAKTAARKNFDGSSNLFEACWQLYRKYLRGAIDNPSNQADVDSWLEQIASEKVNNPRSSFYIYG